MGCSFLLGALLVGGAAAISNMVDSSSRLIRSEDKKLKHVVGAAGEVKGKQTLLENSPLEPSTGAKGSVAEQDLCAEDYLYGEQGKDDCGEALHIDRRAMCENAAEVLKLSEGLPAQGKPFEIDSASYEVYPRGCFKKDGEDVLWYNDFGDIPNNVMAISKPLCHKPKYKLGGNDTNDGGCTDPWRRVMTEAECRTYVECTGHDSISEFRVGVNATSPSNDERPSDAGPEYFDHRPVGCFINHGDQRVYYNVPRDVEPAAPKGAPVCVITMGTNVVITAAGGAAPAGPAPAP